MSTHDDENDTSTSSNKPSNTKNNTLLLIDVQKDFHPGNVSSSLAIPTADADAARIAAWIRAHECSLHRIVATLDSHHPLHIAHPYFWVRGSGDYDKLDRPQSQSHQHPDPFTIISADDIRRGIWKPRDDIVIPPSSHLDPLVFANADRVTNDDVDGSSTQIDLQKYCLEYATRLEERGRFQICVWPEHCLIGSEGHGLVDEVRLALLDWSRRTGRSVEYVTKGQHLLTEMYSAVAAEVPVSRDTQFNHSLQTLLLESSHLTVCGQALSHCVNYTLRDILSQWPAERATDITLLTDCASAVPGFEAAAEVFLNDMADAGVQLKKSTEL